MWLKIEGRRDAVWDYYRIGRCLEGREEGGVRRCIRKTLTDG